nr:hypothetical protein [uncultured Flavobacterium sp.]
MKNFILTLFILFNLQLKAQSFSFADLKYILQNSTENCDSYLGNKNYFFMKSEEGKTNTDCSSTTWAFKRNSQNDRAKSFVIKNCDTANKGFIFYQFSNKQTYESIKTYCKKQSFKFIEKWNSPYGTIWFTFKSNKYKIDFGSGLDDQTNENIYIITLENL